MCVWLSSPARILRGDRAGIGEVAATSPGCLIIEGIFIVSLSAGAHVSTAERKLGNAKQQVGEKHNGSLLRWQGPSTVDFKRLIGSDLDQIRGNHITNCLSSITAESVSGAGM